MLLKRSPQSRSSKGPSRPKGTPADELEIRLKQATQQRMKLQAAFAHLHQVESHCAPNNILFVEAARDFAHEKSKAEEVCDTDLLKQLRIQDVQQRIGCPSAPTVSPSRPVPKKAVNPRCLFSLDPTWREDFERAARKDPATFRAHLYLTGTGSARAGARLPLSTRKSAERLHRGKVQPEFDDEVLAIARDIHAGNHFQKVRRKLDLEEMEDVSQRLGRDDPQSRRDNVKAKEAKFYDEEPRRHLSPRSLTQAIARYEEDLQYRAEKKVELDEKYYPTVPSRKLHSTELSDMAERLSKGRTSLPAI